jgi:hypothetical protein
MGIANCPDISAAVIVPSIVGVNLGASRSIARAGLAHRQTAISNSDIREFIIFLSFIESDTLA